MPANKNWANKTSKYNNKKSAPKKIEKDSDNFDIEN